jgi:CubicO group peptidase (beta-lactamase class C family)
MTVIQATPNVTKNNTMSEHPPFPAAKDCDPLQLGWMQGLPPAADKIIQFKDGSGYRFPQLRWSFAHYRQLVPTVTVSRGLAASSPLPIATHALPDIRYTPLDGGTPCSWADMMAATYTDALLVMHKGQVVFEHFGGVMGPLRQHIAMSVSKSFMGLLAACLVAEGALDDAQRVDHYVPELTDSGFGHATVRQVMDMTTGIDYTENYADPQAEIWNHMRAGGVMPCPPNYNGPGSFDAYLKTVRPLGEHGQQFTYRTANTDVLGWIVRRVSGQSTEHLLSERIWQPMGAELDAYYTVDPVGTAFAGGGLNTGLRDLARFGELVRNHGRANERQILPEAAVADTLAGADPARFAANGPATLKGWSYRNMWWVSHNAHAAVMARGVHGQNIYIDPKAEMVIARYASHPIAANIANDVHTLPAYHAMAQALLA